MPLRAAATRPVGGLRSLSEEGGVLPLGPLTPGLPPQNRHTRARTQSLIVPPHRQEPHMCRAARACTRPCTPEPVESRVAGQLRDCASALRFCAAQRSALHQGSPAIPCHVPCESASSMEGEGVALSCSRYMGRAVLPLHSPSRL